jgi:hypothetical protein
MEGGRVRRDRPRIAVFGPAIIVPRLVFGLAVIALGVLFTLDKMGVVDIGDYWAYWPVLLIAVGLGRLLQARCGHSRSSGLVWLCIGTAILLVNLDVVPDTVWHYWPVLLVLLGGSIVWRAATGHGHREAREARAAWRDEAESAAAPFAAPGTVGTAGIGGVGAATDAATAGASAGSGGYAAAGSTVSAFAALGGVRRRCVSQDFKGGDLNAIMGGCELDLRQASIASGEAVIDVFAMWGGVDIQVPEDWTVVVEGVPILGAFVDKTRHVGASGTKVLVIRGTAIMGGVEVKN